MRKKSILFMLINMNVGGTEKALLNMISEMSKDRYDITILMLEEYGGFLDSIPSGVRIEYFKGYQNIRELLERPLHLTALDFLKKGKVIKGLIILFLFFISKFTKERSLFYKYTLRECPIFKKQYDIAVAYAGPMDFISYFIAHKIKAKKKIQWIHFDITKIGFNKYFAAKIYKKFDRIVAVSEESKNRLINVVPDLIGKTEVFKNVISSKVIHEKARLSKGFSDEFDGVRILTVGRLSFEKGQDIAIRVLVRLLEKGYKVKWYCLGEGDLRKKIEELNREYGLKDHFIFLGTDPNPYPYIKHCDIYVQPSRHEGFCITLAEARVLNKPIVTTDFAGAKEQIKDGKTGLIVKIDEIEIYNGIIKLIKNEDLRKEFSSNLAIDSFSYVTEVKKINNLFNRTF